MSAGLLAGIARRVITPPVGVPLVGFAGRGPATSIHDDLTATALVLRSGETTAVLIGLDLCFTNEADIAWWRERLGGELGIAADHVHAGASHTHYGPSIPSDDPLLAEYHPAMREAVLAAALEAAERLEPVTVGFGQSTMDIGINRRERLPDGRIVLGNNPDGPVDRDVLVLRFDTADGRPLAAVLNACCHAVCGGGKYRAVSACWPGVARTRLEAETGAMGLFLQGASADVNPLALIEGHETADDLGGRAGGAAVAAWREATPAPTDALAVTSRAIEVPKYRFGSPEKAQAIAEEWRRTAETTDNEGTRWWATHIVERAEAALAAYAGEPLAPITSEVSGWRIGPAALAMGPGELFTRIGWGVKAQAPSPSALFAGYSDGRIGYVPTPEEYAIGGYEVDYACHVDPPAAGIIEQACVEAMRASWERCEAKVRA